MSAEQGSSDSDYDPAELFDKIVRDTRERASRPCLKSGLLGYKLNALKAIGNQVNRADGEYLLVSETCERVGCGFCVNHFLKARNGFVTKVRFRESGKCIKGGIFRKDK